MVKGDLVVQTHNGNVKEGKKEGWAYQYQYATIIPKE